MHKINTARQSKFKIDLGVAVKRARSRLGLSQLELAQRSGLHRSYVSDVERGARNPTVVSIQKIAHALRVSVAKLFEAASNGNR